MSKLKISLSFVAASVCTLFFVSAVSFAAEAPPNTPRQTVVPVKENTADTSYVYDLKKLIEKSKDNIKRVNEKIQEQATYKRNQQREEKAREYYERAVQLLEDGKIQESRDLWEKSIKLTEHAEMKNYIRGSEKRFKLQEKAIKKEDRVREERLSEQQNLRQQQVQEAYNSGVTLYKQKKFKESRDEFILVEQLMPEYKATRSYLKLIEQDILVQDKGDIKKQQKEIQRQQEDAEVARVREKEMWRKEIELKEQERRSKLIKQAKDVYTQALDLYRKKDFVGAKEKFQEVEWVIPDYKATRTYLDKLDSDIKVQEQVFIEQKNKDRSKQGWAEELAHRKIEAQRKKEFELKSDEEKRKNAQQAEIYYQKATKLMEDKNYSEARDQFLEIQKFYPEYKGTTTYLTRLNQKLGIIETAPEKVTGEVKVIYAEAVRAFKSKDFASAKLKFEKIEFMSPDYESTRRYLSKLDGDYDVKKAVLSDTDKAILKEQSSLEFADAKPVDSAEYKVLVEKVEPMYAQALLLYEEKKYDESLKQFQLVENTLPNYKSARPYLKRVNQQIKRVEQQRYKEEQTKQAETINILAKQASTLFQKIQQLSDDSTTASAKKKFAIVDRLFANMSREQAKLLAEIAEEEQKLKLEEIAYEQEVQKSEFANAVDPIYAEAVKLYQDKKYDEAKAKFLEAQSTITDYRSSNRYLALIEKQNQLLQQVMKDREEKIKEYQLKSDENARIDAKNKLQSKEGAMIKELVAQAEAINDEIVNLSKDRNFEVIKAKFAELEKVVDNLLTIKSTISQRENSERFGVQKRPGMKIDSKKIIPKAGVDKAGALNASQVSSENPDVPRSFLPPTGDRKKHAAENRVMVKEGSDQKRRFREMDKQNRTLYREAKADYDNGKYSEAKAKFIRLEQQPGYSTSSRKYVQSIDQRLLKRQGRVLNAQERQRQNLIDSKATVQRQAFRIQEAHLNDSLEGRARAKAFSQSGSMMSMSSGVNDDYIDSLNLRGRRTVAPQVVSEEQVSDMKDVSVEQSVELLDADKIIENDPVEVDSLESKGASPNEDSSWMNRRKQKAISNKRKKYLDEKYKETQKEESAKKDSQNFAGEPEASVAAVSKKSKPEDKLSRQQRERALKQQALYERTLRRSNDNVLDKAIAASDKEDQANQRSKIQKEQEMLRQQREEEMSQRSDKERQITTMISQGGDIEGAPKNDYSDLRSQRLKKNSPPVFEKSRAASEVADQRTAAQSLNVDKTAMRKQFESGVDELYREALTYYKSGMYKESRERLTDVEDLYPDYKRTRTYMQRVDDAIINEQKRRLNSKDRRQYDSLQSGGSTSKAAKSVSKKVPTASLPAEDSSSNKTDVISSALDLYEAGK